MDGADHYFLLSILLPPVCIETNVGNVFSSLMRDTQTEDIAGLKARTTGHLGQMLSTAAAESISMASTVLTFPH